MNLVLCMGEEGDHCKDDEAGSDAPPTLEPVHRQQIDSIPNEDDDDDESAPEIPIAVECSVAVSSRCSPVSAISPITPPSAGAPEVCGAGGDLAEDIPPQQPTDCSAPFPATTGSDDGFPSVAKRVEFHDDDESMTATLEAATSEVEQDPISSYNRSQVDLMDEDTPLDFSMKKPSLENGPRSCSPSPSPCGGDSSFENEGDGPLDLSVPRRKKAPAVAHDIPRQSKMARLESIVAKPSSPWGYCSPKTIPAAMPGKPEMVEPTLWNGKVKNERSGVTGVHYGSSSSRHSSGSASSVNVSLSLLQSAKGVPGVVPDKQSSSSYDKVSDHGKGVPKSEGFRAGNRQNPWQTQWMSRSSEQARDVFTCVWCRESFRSLAEMTVHMKQSPRCGMAGMQSSIPSTSPTPPSTTAANSTQPAHQQPTTSKTSSASSTSSSSASGSSSVLVKESMPLPRKLVRGQDVWLGKGAEQTRQILKCMWCGQSFKSLADMTTHMRVTQHYTNIISQEQIISWRTPEDKMTAQSQLNAVLTCKVCDQAFGSLKELTYHMVKNSHYKEHILRSITEGGGRRRQTRERRKKSLPVRKLLELERMELHKHTPKSSNQNHALSPSKSEAAFGTITCEECAEKVDAKDFVQHIKSCGQGSKSQQLLKSALLSQASSGGKSSTMEGTGNCSSASVTPNSVSSASQDMHGEDSQSSKHPATEMTEPESEKPCDGEGETPGTTSVLNAIEKLIEKSFDSKGRRGGAPSAGILQRLGIDEEVCPPWHTSGSPNTLGVIRNGADMSLRQTTLSPSALRVTDFKDRSNGSMSDAGCRSPTSSTSSLMDEQNEPGGLGISQSSVPNTLYLPSTQERQHRSSSRLTPHSKPSSPQLPTNLVVNQICKTNQEDDEGADSPESTRPASVDNPTCLTVKTRSYDATSHQESESSKVSPRGAKDGSAERASSEAGEMDDVTSSADAAVEKSDVADSTAEQSNKFDRPSSGSGRKSSESPCDSLSALRVKSPAESGSHANTGEAVSSATSSGSDPPPNHPLRELQKLLDKTDAHLSRPNPQTSPGSILAFSWACSDAATSDSLMKCAFCETHFISKGAYRHHLSKMHFIKDGNVADSPTWKATQSGTTPAATTTTSKTNSEVVSPKGSPSSSQEESPHTKFLKYTELAKQLSSKYV